MIMAPKTLRVSWSVRTTESKSRRVWPSEVQVQGPQRSTCGRALWLWIRGLRSGSLGSEGQARAPQCIWLNLSTFMPQL